MFHLEDQPVSIDTKQLVFGPAQCDDYRGCLRPAGLRRESNGPAPGAQPAWW